MSFFNNDSDEWSTYDSDGHDKELLNSDVERPYVDTFFNGKQFCTQGK